MIRIAFSVLFVKNSKPDPEVPGRTIQISDLSHFKGSRGRDFWNDLLGQYLDVIHHIEDRVQEDQ
ncbi:MAG: hypothetical protein V3U24_02245, partial [Candidatus Neomarinimicrobiota bacterium]